MAEKKTSKTENGKANRRKQAPKGPLFPNGMPADENGAPLENVPLQADEVRRLGAFDPQSARVTQMHRNTMAAKAAGEQVIWNPDPRIALEEIYQVYPNAKLEIVQIQPKRDDKIPSRPLSYIRDYDGLRRYLMDAHWNRREDAVYQWFARAAGLPQIGTGQIYLAREEEDMQQNGGKGGGYPPQQHYPPPAGYWPAHPHLPAYPQAPQYPFQQPQYPQYGQPQYPQAPAPQPQATPPQQPHEPAAPAPGQPLPVINPDGTQAGWLINGVFYAMQASAQAAPQPQQPAPPPPPPAPAPTPVAQTGDFQAFLVAQLLDMAKQNTAFTEQMRYMFDQQRQQQHAPQPFFPTYPGLMPVSYGVPPGFHVAQPQSPQQPQPPQPQQPAPAAPEKPLTPIEMMSAQMREQIQALKLQKEFTDTVRGIAGVPDEPEEPPAPVVPVAAPEEDFPIKVKEINGVTIGSVDGEVMSTGEMALLNAPKLMGIATGFIDRMFERFDKVKTDKKQEVDAELAKKREEVELEERATKARKEAQDAKMQFEQKRLEIRAAHQFLDTQVSQPEPAVPPPPPPPPPAARVDIVPPPPPPVMRTAVEPTPEPQPAPEPRVEPTPAPNEVLEEEPDPPQIPDVG